MPVALIVVFPSGQPGESNMWRRWLRERHEILAEFQTLTLQDGDRKRLYDVFDELNLVIGPKAAEELVINHFGDHQTSAIKRTFSCYGGDQRAHRLVDRASAEDDHRRAISMLRRALQYGRLGMQAHKAYGDLGWRYEELGNIKRALHYYSQAIDIGDEHDAWTVFQRGRLYVQIGKWELAAIDMQRALALHISSPEQEQAEEYLAQIARVAGVTDQ